MKFLGRFGDFKIFGGSGLLVALAGLALCFATGVMTGAVTGSSGAAFANQRASGLPLPRFVSLRADEVNMRAGPSVRYPVEWVYKRQNLPVEVIAEFDTWRKVRDPFGGQGWIHRSMLSSNRTAVVVGKVRTLRVHADTRSLPVANVEPNAVGKLIGCDKDDIWCRVDFNGYDGWLRRKEIWGVYPREEVK